MTRANAVERLALATHCLADKTGTLTEGRFRLRSVTPLAAVSVSRCLALAAALERYATHPAASAIVAAAGIGGREEVVAASGVPGSATRTPGPEDCCSGLRTGAAGPEASDFGPGTKTSDPVAHCADSVVEDARTHTGGLSRAGSAAFATPWAVRNTSPAPVRLPRGHPMPATAATTLLPRRPVMRPSRASNARSLPLEPLLRNRLRPAVVPAPSARMNGAAETTETPAVTGPAEATATGSDETGDAGTRVFLAREGVLLARFVLADTLRADAGKLIEGLRARGIETTIASGDSAGAVENAPPPRSGSRTISPGSLRRTSSPRRPGSPRAASGC